MKKQSSGKTQKLGRQRSTEAAVIEGRYSGLSTLQRVDPIRPAPVVKDSIKPISSAAEAQAIPAGTPILHTSTDSRVLRAKIHVRLQRQGIEPAVDQLFSELGSSVVRFSQAVSEVRGYGFLSGYRAGLTLDRERPARGISAPFKAFLVNPLHGKLYGNTSLDVAAKMLNAMKLEAVKAKLGKSADTNKSKAELEQLSKALDENGSHARVLHELQTVVGRNWEANKVAREAFADTGAGRYFHTMSKEAAARRSEIWRGAAVNHYRKQLALKPQAAAKDAPLTWGKDKGR